VIKAEQDLLGTEGEKGREGGGGQKGGEMTQTMYAHVNKTIKKTLNLFLYREYQGSTILPFVSKYIYIYI
jgi:hypothetical protein